MRKRPGPKPIPPEEKLKLLGTRLSLETLQTFRSMAEQQGTNVCALGRKVIEQYVTQNTSRYSESVNQNPPAA